MLYSIFGLIKLEFTILNSFEHFDGEGYILSLILILLILANFVFNLIFTKASLTNLLKSKAILSKSGEEYP